MYRHDPDVGLGCCDIQIQRFKNTTFITNIALCKGGKKKTKVLKEKKKKREMKK